MRVLFITRTHPHRALGALEARLHDRLRELSELGHDVLVLTKWSGEAIDFELPARIEIRAPFKSFQAWEWPKSLPMVFAWRPDVLHVFDPGLSAIERTLSVEMIAVTMLETLRRSTRGRSTYKGAMVSHLNDGRVSNDSWKRAGAGVVENGWLQPSGNERSIRPWDRAYDRNLRVVLAGQVGSEIPFELVLEALEALRGRDGIELSVFATRSRLTTDQRRRLAQAERGEAFGRAVGSRLRLLDPAAELPAEPFDAAIVTGLDLPTARVWVEKLPMPIALSENLKPLAKELETRGMAAQIFERFTSDLAPMAQAFGLISDRDLLLRVWSEIEQGALAGGRDVAANRLSRIYSQIARSPSSS